MRKFKVYASGPITNLTFNQAHSWTDYVKDELDIHGIDVYKPLRGKGFLSDKETMAAMGYDKNPLSTPKGIFIRDLYDVRTCDVVLVNVLHATEMSAGTIWEMSCAFEHHKPIVLVMQKEGNPHHRLFPIEGCSYWVQDLDVAMSIVKHILLP